LGLHTAPAVQQLLTHAPGSVRVLMARDADSAGSAAVERLLAKLLAGEWPEAAGLQALLEQLPAAVEGARGNVERLQEAGGAAEGLGGAARACRHDGKRRLTALWLVVAQLLRAVGTCDDVRDEARSERMSMLCGLSGHGAREEAGENCQRGSNSNAGEGAVALGGAKAVGVCANAAVAWLQAQLSSPQRCPRTATGGVRCMAARAVPLLRASLEIAMHERHALELRYAVLACCEVRPARMRHDAAAAIWHA
jgi:hypothetical protein